MNTSMKNSKNTVIIGGGAWGTAIAHQLRLGAAQIGAAQNSTLLVRASSTVHALEKGHIRQHPEIKGRSGFNATIDLTCLKEADIVSLVVHFAAHAEMLDRIKSDTKQNCAIVLCAKGLMPDTEKGGIFLHEYAAKHLGQRPLALFTGPSFADEVLKGLPTALLAASLQTDLSACLAAQFENSQLRVYQGSDVIGAALGGTVKNVIAIAAGICAGQQLGDNARAGLITRGLAETMRLADKLGAQRATMSGLAGIGDLILSCSNSHSRNMAFGMALGSGVTIPEKLAEGRHSAAYLCARARFEGIEMPVCEAVDKIVNHKANIKTTIAKLLSRQAGSE